MNPIEQLLNLQKIDSEIREIEKEMKDIPARKEYESARLQDLKKEIENIQKTIKSEEASLKQVELEAKSITEKIQKLRQQQFELKSNKEFKAMEAEIDNHKAEISKLEDQQLNIMEKIDSAKKNMAEKMLFLQQQETVLSRDLKMLDERNNNLKASLLLLKNERQKIASEIPSSFLKPYERIFLCKDKAIVTVEKGICGGCHMQLPPALVHDARKHVDLVACNFCGRLLY